MDDRWLSGRNDQLRLEPWRQLDDHVEAKIRALMSEAASGQPAAAGHWRP